MLEQELASIIAFLLKALGEVYPYYHTMPQSFKVPAIYFPSPEINTGADTLESFTVEYAWYIKIFCTFIKYLHYCVIKLFCFDCKL